MKRRLHWLWQFVKVVLCTTLIDGIVTGIYLTISKTVSDYVIVRIIWAFAYDIWFVIFFSLVLAGLCRLFPRSVGSLQGQISIGALIGGLAGLFLFSQFWLVYPTLSYRNFIEMSLFAIVGGTCGYLHWLLIPEPANNM